MTHQSERERTREKKEENIFSMFRTHLLCKSKRKEVSWIPLLNFRHMTVRFLFVKNTTKEKSVAFRSLSCQKIKRSDVLSLVIVRTTTILAVVVPRDHEWNSWLLGSCDAMVFSFFPLPFYFFFLFLLHRVVFFSVNSVSRSLQPPDFFSFLRR